MPTRSILALMPSRVIRFLVGVLSFVLLAQPIPALAFASQDSTSCCCKDSSASCCRRSHHLSGPASGPAFSSRDCCGQCQVLIRQTQPVAETVAPVIAFAQPAPRISKATAALDGFPSTHSDLALYQRPPPSAL